MTQTVRDPRWDVPADVWQKARTKLPLRLPRPEETGARKDEPLAPRKVIAAVLSEAKPDHRRVHRPVDRRPVREFTDQELAQAVRQVFLRSGLRGFSQLSVEVRDRMVELQGELASDFERQLAAQLARRVNGVEFVEHRIVITDEQTEPAVRVTHRRIPAWLWLSAAALLPAVLAGGVWMMVR